MPCYHPLKAQRSASGVQILSGDAPLWSFKVPCGQCVGCRLERSRQWALRCMHESTLHEHNAYITLTYNDENVPHDGGLHHRDFQLFLKRLRKHFNHPVRYYMCGEYGGQFGRPHFHAILFGVNFADYTEWRRSPSGEMLFRSATLERLWPYGYSSIGAVTFESAAYVARYIMKKATGDKYHRTYDSVNTETGEVFTRNPEYNRMSLKPGIGADWYSKYKGDVFPHDRVIYDGISQKPPRYYDKLYSRDNPDSFIEIKSKRMLDMNDNWRDNTPNRLLAKETVTNAKLSKLKRGLL